MGLKITKPLLLRGIFPGSTNVLPEYLFIRSLSSERKRKNKTKKKFQNKNIFWEKENQTCIPPPNVRAVASVQSPRATNVINRAHRPAEQTLALIKRKKIKQL